MTKKHFKITSAIAGKRIDQVMASQHGHSRAFWQRAIKDGLVRVNQLTEKSSYQVVAGDLIEFSDVSMDSQKTDISAPQLVIMYEDNHLLVVEKPSGLLVHDVPGRALEPTLAQFAALHTSDQSTNRPGIVHRLDRDTSGLVLIAKDSATKAFLQKQFKDRLVKKTYQLLIEGHLKRPEALIDLPIGRKPNTAKRNITPSGKPSQTSYTILSEYDKYTLLEAHPKTGRTHQLRVHFSHLGHPIVGDGLYGRKSHSKPERLFLHAVSIEFTDTEGKQVTVRSPLPPELKQFLLTLSI